jgi:hypothetical protein
VVHGDARVENFFFDPVKVIDPQLAREAPPGLDVGYFIGG